MDWEDLRHFAAFAQAGSLAAAARLLGVEHATIARRIAQLEARLGLKLIDRRERRIVLTEEGHRLSDIAGRMQREADAALRVAAHASATLTGSVTLSAPPAYAAAILARPLTELAEKNPGLRIQIIGEVRYASLDKREADLALRLGRPEETEMIAVKLGELPFRLYASSAYLARTPPEDRRYIANAGAMAHSPQQGLLEKLNKGANFPMGASNVELQKALAEAGAGIAVLPDFMVDANGALMAVEPGAVLLTRDIWLVVHPDMRSARPVRAVIDCLKDAHRRFVARDGEDFRTRTSTEAPAAQPPH
jgi:DNA-binding transcriptional LysR family regulator